MLGDFEAVAFEADDFFRVVGEEFDAADAKVVEDLGAHAVVAEVGGEAEFFVGLDGVESLLLKLVGVDFRGQADTAAFLAEVKEDSAVLGNALHRGGELRAAIAALGVEHIAGEAFGMDADEGRFLGIDLASCQGEVVGIVEGNGVEMAVEIAELGGHKDGLVAFHEFLGTAAVFDELRDGAGLEAMLFLIIAELADAGHGAVLAHDFTDCADGWESGEGGEVDGGFGVAGAAEDTAGHGLEREDVAGFHQVLGVSCGIGEEADGEGAVGGGDAGGDALGGVHGNSERGFHALMVAAGHLRKVEFLGALHRKGRTD